MSIAQRLPVAVGASRWPSAVSGRLEAGRLAGAAGPAGLDGGRLGQQGPVVLDGADGGVAPGPAVDDPLAAGGTDAGPQLGVVEGGARSWPPGPRCRPGATTQGGVVVGADDLGQGAAGGGDQRHAAGHGLDGRQREALVERRDDGHLGLGVELDDALLGHAGDERDDVAQAELVDACGPTGRLPSRDR